MKKFSAIASIIILSFFTNKALAEVDTLFYKKVARDLGFHQIFKEKLGYILLTDDSIIFRTKKRKNKEFDFAISYHKIIYIRPSYRFLFPNRTRIKTFDGRSYIIITYKKKKIIALTRKRMSGN